MAHPTWCGRLAWFERYGYDERAVGCEDQDLLRRSWRESRFSNLDEILLGYREHEIRLAATVRTRRSTIASVARAECGWSRSETARAVLEQTSKGVLETLAWVARQDGRVRSRQRQPLLPDDRTHWADVWKRVND